MIRVISLKALNFGKPMARLKEQNSLLILKTTLRPPLVFTFYKWKTYGHVLFVASSQDQAFYLWSTDETEVGIRKIAGVKNVQGLKVMNDVLYFSGEGPEGTELWKYIPESKIATAVEVKH